MHDTSSLPLGLIATGPAADRAKALELYGWLVGQWSIDVQAFDAGGKQHSYSGEIYAGWILEGRAIQDVWMIPTRAERSTPPNHNDFPVTGPWCGTTLRVYDPKLDAWRIHWIDPATGFQARMIGRADASGIIQEGTLDSGSQLRWRFRDLQANSFRWTGEVSLDSGKQWLLQVDITARRIQ